MIKLEDYQDRYEYIKLSRDAAGVLTMRLHCNGGKFIFSLQSHDEIADCLLHISRDWYNKIVILTGTGEAFIDEFMTNEPDAPNFKDSSQYGPTFKDGWSKILPEGRYMVQNHVDVQVPMIGVVNGPASWHAELAVMCDIVICSDDTFFQDLPHVPSGMVPGDGVHIIWPEILGLNRGRYFLLTGQKIYAEEALELGIVSEVMPREALLDRANEMAAELATRDHIFLRHTRSVLVQKLRKQVVDLLPLGLHAEYASAMADTALPRPEGVDWRD
ncbi:MAG: enoyl-CoA hydratase/isomerase family protein [Proteobacteria bacterium]|nr:enoyl-CoA hydratase/isomerase family protein [Pseudomonadota bacterium]